MKKGLLTILLLALYANISFSQYCASVADSTGTFDILKVELNGNAGTSLNNRTTCGSLSGTQGTAMGASKSSRYSDFTIDTIVPRPRLQMGNFHTLSVLTNACTTPSYGGIRMAFIDWNHDGDFTDTLEKILIDTAYSSDTFKSVQFRVPFGSYSGITRMRIVYRLMTTISLMNSCAISAGSNVGETEDYEVEILDCSNYTSSFTINGSSNSNVTVASGSSVSFSGSATSGAMNYQWYRNGFPISGAIYPNFPISYADTSSSGCYILAAIYPNGCLVKSATKCLTVTGCNPTTTTQVDSPCIGTTVYFNGNAITTTGNYRDTLKTTYGCDSFISLYLVFKPCSSPKCFQFKNISFNKAGQVFYFTSSGPTTVPYPFTVRYSWKFSNGITSTQKNPIITSLPNGYNWAKLTVCIDSGSTTICCDSSFRDSVMNTNCNMYCTITKSGDTLKVTATGGVTPRYYNWNTGATGERLKVTTAGTYCVTVYDSTGCSTNCCFTVTNSNPCSQFKFYTFTRMDSLYYFSSPIPSSYNAVYYWDFGNNQTSTQANPTVIYANDGNYYVKFKYCLRDSSNSVICCDSVTRLIEYRKQVPCNVHANFYWTSLSNGGSYRFMDSSTPSTANCTYSWYFGDGTYSSAKNPEKTFMTNGTYSVLLKVCKYINYSNQYCCDTIRKTITVTNANPCNRFLPNFTWTYTGGSYQISNTTNLTGFNVVSTSFTVSNGSSFNYNNPNITFSYSGNYSITMTMTVYDPTTGSTCTKTITKYIYAANSVCGCLKAYFSYTKSNKTISITNASTCVDSNTRYLYKFGNGDTSSSPNPTYTYSLPGIYRTVLYVTKTVGSITCKDSIVKIIQVTTANPCKDSGFTTYYNYNCGSYTSPVCGCDSVTYQNYCFAYKAGVKQFYSGPCANDTSYVKICGYVYRDDNKNCSHDSTDAPLPNVRIDFNSSPAMSVYTNASGYYSIYLRKGTYTATQNLNTSYSQFPLHQLCPSGAITVNASTPGVYCNNNFYDTTNTCPDLSVKIGRSSNITPGYPSWKWIQYKNNGATAITGAVLKYRYLSGLTVLNTTSATYSQSGNVITWNLGTIPAYSTGFKYAKFYTPTSGISIGTTVVDSVWIEPISGDCHPNNNSATYNDTCTSSWDPNDKSTAQARWMDTSVKTLDYHIRFQNTGTAPAHNVVVTDDIDPNLDLTTLKINGYSHPMTFELEDNRRLTFEFANIMLPDSGTDYEASQGYINYSIDRKPSTPIGVDIKNTASIYFDFNDAVVTNTTINTLYLKSSSSVQTLIDDVQITLFPNPVKESATLNVSSDKNVKVSYNLYDINGRIIASEGESKSSLKFEKELSLKSLHTGFYILNVKVNGVEKSIKIVKE